MSTRVPPGWPPEVRPPGAPGFEQSAVAWLLDQCPADFRAYAAWRRHPRALAWVACTHVDAQVSAMRQAYRNARVELGDQLTPTALRDVLGDLEVEGLRLRAVARSAALVRDALWGVVFVPKL